MPFQSEQKLAIVRTEGKSSSLILSRILCNICDQSYNKATIKRHFQTKKHLNRLHRLPLISSNNETYGMSIERTICCLFSLPNTIPNTRYKDIPLVSEKILRILVSANLIPVAYTGYINAGTDFILSSGKTLSVKTNISGDKICPQDIGQTTRARFSQHFKLKNSSIPDLKYFILTNPHQLFQEYFLYLFCCDYLLWVTDIGDVELLGKLDAPKALTSANFSFTRTLDWNESTTLKYDGLSIGEFQIHQKRNCIKFRFYLNKTLKLIKRQQSQ